MSFLSKRDVLFCSVSVSKSNYFGNIYMLVPAQIMDQGVAILPSCFRSCSNLKLSQKHIGRDNVFWYNINWVSLVYLILTLKIFNRFNVPILFLHLPKCLYLTARCCSYISVLSLRFCYFMASSICLLHSVCLCVSGFCGSMWYSKQLRLPF